MRFIHAADLHLDTAFRARSDQVRKRLREASREALRGLVDLALSESVDAVVLAGDLFDGDRISFQTERLLAAEMGRLADAGIPVVYATGNHDPGRPGARAGQLAWPDNVHIARGPEPIRVEVPGRGGRPAGSITAVGHEHEQVADDLVPRFPPPMGEGAHVAVLHATVLGSAEAASHARYAPTDIDSLIATGYHYWALGHIHVREELSASPGIHYPGNTQGRTLAERGPKGCFLVDLSEPGAPAVDFHRLGPVQWEDLDVDGIEQANTIDALLGLSTTAWEERTAEFRVDPPGDWIVRIRLAGPSPLWRELADDEGAEALNEELRHALGVLEVSVDASRVHPAFDVEAHLDRRDVLGEALRLARSAREDGLDAAGELMLLGPQDGADLGDYIRELLEGAEPEILSRMLKSGPEGA